MRRLFSMLLGLSIVYQATVCFGEAAVSVVSRDVVPLARQPQAAVNDEGIVFVAFGSGETVYCCVSQDQGKSFAKPVVVAQVKGLALGKRRGPRIVAHHAQIVVSAISHHSGDLLAWRSADGGNTWSDRTTVNDFPKVAAEGLHAMALSPRGQLFCTWLDLRSKKTEIAGARSTDGGATWDKNQLVYRSPSGTVCECCHPSAAYDASGRLLVMWRNALEGNRDMYLSSSADTGGPFSPAVKLGTGAWRLNACPMDGGALAASTDGTVTTIWRRDRQIIRAVSGKPSEEDLGLGEQPWAAATGAGPYLTWVSRRGGDLWLQRPSDRKPTRVAAGAADPVIAAPPSAAGPIVVVWESGHGKDVAILAETIQP